MKRSPISTKFFAVALVSAAILVLQITVTRILSVVLWYHWAFFAISLTMLGLGAPGVWFTFTQNRERWLPRLLLLGALLVPVGIIIMIKGSKYAGDWEIISCMATLLPGVLALGGSVCLMLLEAKGPSVGKMYAFDLLGACAGALLVIPLMWLVPTPALAAATGLLPLVSYLMIGGNRVLGGGVMVLVVVSIIMEEPYRLRSSKMYEESGSKMTPVYERWTPTARLTVFDNIFFMDATDGFGWGRGSQPSLRPPMKQYWLEQDGSAGTPITQFDGDFSRLEYLLHDVTSMPYQFKQPKRVAIIGTGGGRDILTALLTGSSHVDAIELNAGIVEVMKGRFAKLSGGIYLRQGVNPIVGEGRSVITSSQGNYDLIQISLIDSWAATAAGAYSLSENNLYTLEAYRLYWSKLSSQGVISTSRWMRGESGAELFRLLLLAKEALIRDGVSDPLKHLVVMQGRDIGTVLMCKSALTRPEVHKLMTIARKRGFTLHLPVTELAPSRRRVFEVYENGPVMYSTDSLMMEPPIDDKPFFFQMLSPLRPVDETVASKMGINAEGIIALQKLIVVTAVVTLLLFFAPFVLAQWIQSDRSFWRGSAFFICIGLSFMFVEVAWLQKFILYLGHPSLATTVILGAILLGAGIGSMTSVRLGVIGGARWGFILPLAVLASNSVIGPLFSFTLGCSWFARLAISILLVTPVGYAMGFFFPLGMTRFGERHKAWFLALNGAAGVMASVTSPALSMEFGFTVVAFLGAAIYAIAWLLLRG